MDAHLDMGEKVRDGYSGTKLAAWATLALTFLLMLFDFIDRQIVVSMLPAIKVEWNLSDTELGGLVSIVSIVIAFLSIPVALLADRWSRVKCVVFMAVLWSLATIACAYATSYNQLFALRGLVGVGEAGYNAVGCAILASLFPTRMRAAILASFSAAAAVGAVLGVLLGGILAKNYGWHAAFGIVGAPGLVLATLYLFVRDYKTVALTDAKTPANQARLGLVKMAQLLITTPSALMIYVGGGLQLFVVSTVYSWLPSFFNRYYNLAMDQAGVKAAVVLLLSSLAAVLWGVLADVTSRTKPQNKIWVMALSSLSSFIVLTIAFAVLPAGPQQYAAIIAGAMLMTGSIGSVSAISIDVVHPGMRATAVAVGVLIGNLLGLGAGPLVSGMVSDKYGLAAALAVVPAFGLLATIAFALTVGLYKRDLAGIAGIVRKPIAFEAPAAA